MSDAVTHQAEQLVAEAVRRQHVDGVTDLATALPLSVVPDSSAGRRTDASTCCDGAEPHSMCSAR